MGRNERDRVLWVVIGAFVLLMLAWPMLAWPMLGGGPLGYAVAGPRFFGGGWLLGLALVGAGLLLLARRGRRAWVDGPHVGGPHAAAAAPPAGHAEPTA